MTIQLVFKHRQPTSNHLQMKQCKQTSTTATPKPSALPTVLTNKGSDRHRQDAHILIRYQNQQNSTRTIQHLSITFQSIHLIYILVIDHQHRKYVAGEDPARRRNTCPQYLSRVDGRKKKHKHQHQLEMFIFINELFLKFY